MKQLNKIEGSKNNESELLTNLDILIEVKIAWCSQKLNYAIQETKFYALAVFQIVNFMPFL